MNIAYFDGFSCAAGDMIVGAALDAGAPEDHLRSQLAKLNLSEIELRIEKVVKKGISATSFVPEQVHHHGHEHGHEHHHEAGHHHHHRNLPAIIDIINSASLGEKATEQAISTFKRLARAEAKVHGTSEDEVHFHEVGAADAIMDIVGASVAMESLGIEKVYCSALAVGGGTAECAHGVIPVPAPATVELIKGIPLRPHEAQVEMLTPTGAAILTTVASGFGPMPSMQISSVGYGAGQRDHPKTANVLRLLVGRDAEQATADEVVVLEANLDDATGELIGHLGERLMQAGALDVYCVPIMMKKNRPATLISAICTPADVADLERTLFIESTTLGIRRTTCQRSVLPREHQTVETAYGPIRMKIASLDGKPITCSPEFEDCRNAAAQHDVSLKQVIDAAKAACDLGPPSHKNDPAD